MTQSPQNLQKPNNPQKPNSPQNPNNPQKLWAGRFTQGQNTDFDTFNASIDLDGYLAQVDIQGSKAHAWGLCQIGILSEAELNTTENALDAIAEAIETGAEIPLDQDEDVHMWIERLLTAQVGDLGKKIHTGRSRNDQVATDMKLWLRLKVNEHKRGLRDLISALVSQGDKHQGTLMPGYTHLQQAQPITLGFHLLTYVEMLKRDDLKADQMLVHLGLCPLGSGALAGVRYGVPREEIAGQLGFDGIVTHAMDGVSDRDYVVDYLYWVSVVLGHLSRLSEEMILWSTQHFGYLTLSDAMTSGSSIMPQKKNPDACELIRAKAAIAIGRLTGMQSVLKGLPLAYNKDLQEDKELISLATRDLSSSLRVMTGMLEEATFHPEVMLRALQMGYVNATDLADWLVSKGVAFREAHHLSGAMVLEAIKQAVPLEVLGLECYQKVSPVFTEEIYEALAYENCIKKKTSSGSTAYVEVERMLEAAREWLGSV